MSDLSAQLSAFKNKIRSGPSVTMPRTAIGPQHSQQRQKPTPGQDMENGVERNNGGQTNENGSPSTLGASEKSPNKRGNDTVHEAIKKQRTMNNRNGGSHLSTQLHLAVEYIKQNDKPVAVADLQNYLTFDITQTLLPLLKEIDRIKYDKGTNTLEYVSLHNIRSSEDLLNFLRSQPTFKGIPVKELKDGWSNYLQSINELEQEHKILVLRTKKENSPRLVWANFGGDLNLVDEEYQRLWFQIKLPEKDDLYQALVDQGLKPTGADPNVVNRRPKKEEKKQKKARRGKITNTHMKGILKDYSQMM